jgi:hypothetical protein
MDESNQLVLYANCWNSNVIPVQFKSFIPDGVEMVDFSPRELVYTPLTQALFEGYLEQAPAPDAAAYFYQPDDEEIDQSALDSINRFFACQPEEVIGAFATYLSPCELDADGPWNEEPETGSLGAIRSIPRDRQVRIEAAVKDHVVHLETVTLAEEQEAPTASAVGQMLTSGRELWMRWKKKLLHSLSRSLQSQSCDGFQIALASVALV